MTPVFEIGTGRLPIGSRIALHGYSRTSFIQTEIAGGERDLVANFMPGFHRGTITQYHPHGMGLAKWPVYAHDAESLGGISGGPMIDVNSSAVHAIVCSGLDEPGYDGFGYGTATDLDAIVDWRLRMFGDKSFRDLAKDGKVNLALDFGTQSGERLPPRQPINPSTQAMRRFNNGTCRCVQTHAPKPPQPECPPALHSATRVPFQTGARALPAVQPKPSARFKTTELIARRNCEARSRSFR